MTKSIRDHTGFIPGGSVCPRCGKREWPTRKDAKAAARRFFPGERLSVYRCGDVWHLGHLPTAVRRGHITRDEIWRRGS